jgi:hypothetical protein
MNSTLPFLPELACDLKAYQNLCEEALALTARENQALTHPSEYQPFDFYQLRKDLLPRLEKSLIQLRRWRQTWQQVSPADRSCCAVVKSLFQSVQGLLVKFFLMDRENQQALLRRGLVPTRHLHSVAVQPPHYAASVYKRHSNS